MTFALSLTAIERLAKDHCGLIVLVCREQPGLMLASDGLLG
jgi:hypothetical protein